MLAVACNRGDHVQTCWLTEADLVVFVGYDVKFFNGSANHVGNSDVCFFAK